MIGGWAGVNHGRTCGIAGVRSLIELGERFHLSVDSPLTERQDEAPTEPRTAVLLHRRRMGVADRANRDGDRPTPGICLGSPAWDRGHLARSVRASTTPTPSLREAHPPPRASPTTVIPAEVALGVLSLHKAGIHSPGPGASRQLARPGALHENCLRHLRRWILGSSPRMTMSPGVARDTGSLASGECYPACGAPPSSSPQKSRWAYSHSTKRGSIRQDSARRPGRLGKARCTRAACGFYSPGSSGQAQGRR